MPTRINISDLTTLEQDAIKKARKARGHALPPISDFSVGAAALAKNGFIHMGANVEEPAFGSSIHAETCAITGANAVGDRDLEAVVVCAENLAYPEAFIPPCAHCWQFIHGYAGIIGHPIKIILTHLEGDEVEIMWSGDPSPMPLSFADIGIDLSKWKK